MTTQPFADDRQRFSQVMKARRTDRELLDLFGKLALSDKFAEESKPYCYGDLIAEAAQRVSDKNVHLLMEAVEQMGAAKKVRAVLSDAEAAAALCLLVKRAFDVSPKAEASLMNVFTWSERAGVAPDRGNTIGLGLEAGISMEQMDEICDLTVLAYYPTIRPRLQAGKVHVAERLAA